MKFEEGDHVITVRAVTILDSPNPKQVPAGTRGQFIAYLSEYADKRIVLVGGLIRREEGERYKVYSEVILEDAIELVSGKWHWGAMVLHSERQFTCLLELAERSEESAEKELVDYLNRRYATAWRKSEEGQYVRPNSRSGDLVLGYLISKFVEET